jgi:hypothetical protein
MVILLSGAGVKRRNARSLPSVVRLLSKFLSGSSPSLSLLTLAGPLVPILGVVFAKQGFDLLQALLQQIRAAARRWEGTTGFRHLTVLDFHSNSIQTLE